MPAGRGWQCSLQVGLHLVGVRVYGFFVAALDDLKGLGAPVDDSVATARFIAQLALSNQQKARLLRNYLRESSKALTTDVLVAARDYSFFL